MAIIGVIVLELWMEKESFLNQRIKIGGYSMDRSYGTPCSSHHQQRIKIRCYNMGRSNGTFAYFTEPVARHIL